MSEVPGGGGSTGPRSRSSGEALRGCRRSPQASRPSPVCLRGRRPSELQVRRGERGQARKPPGARCPPMSRKGRCASRVGSPAYSRPRLCYLPQASMSSSALPVRSEGSVRPPHVSVPFECRRSSACALLLVGGPSVHPWRRHPWSTTRRLAELGS
ncbi:hypothetical protein NDU88_010290 [Pleurodeles waltl]|uniref:Uncharacterized protein n=1 Tax=Pleurodeles waltl TaxID=8319 RepID=A0AAV7QZU0_PLEWA|nr:hypothetical protein NDU88_010290 [Pleurodeles waltl]